MTEDYVRRVLPTKWAVDVAKLQERNVTDIISKCGDLCFEGFNDMKLNSKEDACLKKCLYKGVEMMAYLSHEYSDMTVNKARRFEKKAEE